MADMKKIIIIGCGAAGMMAAAAAAENDAGVLVLEKNNSPGKKILITGGGRCNITNIDDANAMMAKVLRNPRFLYSALNEFNSADTMHFFTKIGLKTKVEAGGRVFPVTENAQDVVDVMMKYLRHLGVQFEFDCNVDKIVPRGTIFEIMSDKKTFRSDAAIITTGGLSAPHTGSDGGGFRLAKVLGHSITRLYPALVPLIAEESTAELMGLSIKANLKAFCDRKMVYSGCGDVMFTHYGLSGPVVLEASSYLAEKLHLKPEFLLDFMPGLTEKETDLLLLDIFYRNANKNIKNALEEILPDRLVTVLLRISGVKPDEKVRNIEKATRGLICRNIKGFALKVTGSAGFGAAVVTRGGVDVKQINPSTMESKIVAGLYFAGEILDVDGLTGGYNLQIAFSTGRLSGKSAAKMM